MNIKKNNSGFTLLEIIIVIIIVGVLASLALPRLFATVEYSRSSEAFAAITSIRSSMERCFMQNNGTYQAAGVDGCGVDAAAATDFNLLDLDDPGTSPNAHFTYAITIGADPTQEYTITATRNAVDNGDGASTISLQQYIDGASGDTLIQRAGTGAFSGVK